MMLGYEKLHFHLFRNKRDRVGACEEQLSEYKGLRYYLGIMLVTNML